MIDTRPVGSPPVGTTDPNLGALAELHGLRVAGLRPSPREYARKLWAYRHFTANYANAHTLASLGTTRLGQLWQVLTPIINAAVYYLIFGVILNTRSDVANFIAYLCTGLFVYTFTQAVVQNGTQAISGNLGLIRSLQFPRACLPLAVMLTQLKAYAASLVVLGGIVILTGEPVSTRWLLIVPAATLQAVFNAGLAMVMARLGSVVTDLKQVVPFILRTWMYVSGVLYSAAAFEQRLPHTLAQIAAANPLLVYVELARSALLTNPPLASPVPRLWAYGVAWAVVAALGGFVYFWQGERGYGRG